MIDMGADRKVKLYAVELSKASARNPLRKFVGLNDDGEYRKNDYVCLGHFDRLYIRDFPDNGGAADSIKHNVLTQIDEAYRDNANASNRTYPLYILSSKPSDKLNDFLTKQSVCMAISRVHFGPRWKEDLTASVCTKTDLLVDGLLKDHAKEEDGVVTISTGNTKAECAFFHTLGLGDIVAVIRSNCLSSCLKAIRLLTDISSVGDVYSYIGIHSAFFQEQDKKTFWNLNALENFFGSDTRSFLKENIPYVSMRFSIRAARKAQKIWEYLHSRVPGRKIWFVTGTADSAIDLSGIIVGEFIKYVTGYINCSLPAVDDGSKTFDIYDAFEDIITRVGIEFFEISDTARSLDFDPIPPEIIRAHDLLIDAVKEFDADIQESKSDSQWANSLIAQTNTLTTMMEDCVTDDISMLIWPAALAFWRRLRCFVGKLKSGDKTLSQLFDAEEETNISSFLNRWDVLENDIIRLERQLMQNPELQSSRYHTPAPLMFFYTALLHKFSQFLIAINAEGKAEKYIPLMVFDIIPRTFTICVMDPSKYPDSKEYFGEVPLMVSIPVSLMYRPFTVSIILCHEMAHYVGSSTRRREKRFNCILHSCAGMIAHAWKLDNCEAYPLDGVSYVNVNKEIRDAIEKQLPFGDKGKAFYIRELKDALPNVITKIFYDSQLQSRLLTSYIVREGLQGTLVRYARSFTPKIQYLQHEDIQDVLDNLFVLYRECYADLVVLLCLNLTEDEYLQSVIRIEEQYKQEQTCQQDVRSFLHGHYLRAALVISAVRTVRGKGKIDPIATLSKDVDEGMGTLRNTIDEYMRYIQKKNDISFPDGKGKYRVTITYEYLPLYKYLIGCAEEIYNKVIDESRKQEGLRKMLQVVSGEPDLDTLQIDVRNYRTDILNTLIDNPGASNKE